MFRKGRPDSPKPTHRRLRLGIYSELKCTRHKPARYRSERVFGSSEMGLENENRAKSTLRPRIVFDLISKSECPVSTERAEISHRL